MLSDSVHANSLRRASMEERSHRCTSRAADRVGFLEHLLIKIGSDGYLERLLVYILLGIDTCINSMTSKAWSSSGAPVLCSLSMNVGSTCM